MYIHYNGNSIYYIGVTADPQGVFQGHCKNFVGEWEEFTVNAFLNFVSVQRSEDGCEMKKFSSLTTVRARQFWICWRRFIWLR